MSKTLTTSAILAFGALVLLAGCNQGELGPSVQRLKESCRKVDPDCAKAEAPRDVIENSSLLFSKIKGVCDALPDNGRAICLLKLQDVAGNIRRVGTLVGAWQSVTSYGYEAKGGQKVQVATVGTQYWVGDKDYQGGFYISQNNRNLVCGATDLLPEGKELTEVLHADTGTPGETKEDLLCEKLYPDTPVCLGTYVSLCVSTGWREDERWILNTKADEACVRTFKWRVADREFLGKVRHLLQGYIRTLALDLERCTITTSEKNHNRLVLQCGGKTAVFTDELRRM